MPPFWTAPALHFGGVVHWRIGGAFVGLSTAVLACAATGEPVATRWDHSPDERPRIVRVLGCAELGFSVHRDPRILERPLLDVAIRNRCLRPTPLDVGLRCWLRKRSRACPRHTLRPARRDPLRRDRRRGRRRGAHSPRRAWAGTRSDALRRHDARVPRRRADQVGARMHAPAAGDGRCLRDPISPCNAGRRSAATARRFREGRQPRDRSALATPGGGLLFRENSDIVGYERCSRFGDTWAVDRRPGLLRNPVRALVAPHRRGGAQRVGERRRLARPPSPVLPWGDRSSKRKASKRASVSI